MPKFKITVMEVATTYRATTIEAESEEAAVAQAEGEDWREWEITYQKADTAIEEIEEVDGGEDAGS